MSLEDTGRLVWQTEGIPFATLVASKLTQMAAIALPPEAGEPFVVLSKTLVTWWAKRERPPGELYENEFTACQSTYDEFEPAAKMQPALTGAYLQMTGLLPWFPRGSMPTVAFRELGEEEFLSWIRAAAKIGGLPLPQLEARLKSLLEARRKSQFKHNSWADLVVRADRMYWGRSGSWGKLSKRVRAVAKLADLGAKRTWISIEGQQALSIELDGVKRTTILTTEELAELESVVPNIHQPE